MAPEQLEGGEADARTDIFAFGAILFEMVTGEKAFKGTSSISLMSAILRDTPRLASELRPSTPQPLERLIATCLEKHPDDRWQTARDLVRELRWIGTPGHITATTAATEDVGRRMAMGGALVAAVAALLGATVVWLMTSASNERPAMYRGLVPLGQERVVSIASTVNPLSLSHDGTRLIYAGTLPEAATSRLFLYSFETGETSPIPDTDGATSAFFAPDGERIGFFAAGRVWTKSLSGAPPASGRPPTTLRVFRRTAATPP